VALTAVGATGSFVLAPGTAAPALLPFAALLPGAAGAAAFNGSAATFTAPATGNYRVAASVVSDVAAPATSQDFQLFVVVNGTAVLRSAGGPAAGALTVGAEAILSLAAGQALWAAGTSAAGCTLTFSASGAAPFSAALSIESLF